MLKFKVGDILKIKKGCEDECRISLQVGADSIKITDIDDGDYSYNVLRNGEVVDICSSCFKDNHLELAVKTLHNLEVGDVIVDEEGDEKMVLGVCEKAYLMSVWNNFDSYGQGHTAEELEKNNYKVKGQEETETEEMTMAELCKELGREVKIKKD